MAFPLLPLIASWGKLAGASALAGASFTAGSIIVDKTLPEEDYSSVIVLDTDTKQMIEDVIKTNKALLQYRNVRQDLYEPLNIDAQ